MSEQAPCSLDEAIVSFYSEGTREWGRLEYGRGLLELRRTQELLQRLLPTAPATVLDVGGGPGRYAKWLAGLGYSVTLIEPVPALAEQARGLSKASTSPFRIASGDARALDADDRTTQAVVMMGPLYHLPDTPDRLQALSEAHRVLVPGGTLIAVGICRYAALLDAARVGSLTDELVTRARESFLSDGRFLSGTDGFTQAYFHRPDELSTELERSGFADVQTYGVEGPLWPVLPGARQAAQDDQQPDALESAIRCARETETEASLIGASSHLLAVGHRPNDGRAAHGSV